MYSRHSGRSRPGHKYVPRLEALENRCCLTCVVEVHGDTLRVEGDKANNTIAIVDNGAAGIVVTCDAVASPAATGIDHVVVHTKDGNDILTYSRSAAGGNFTTDLDFSAHLGKGNDSFTANLNGNDLAAGADVRFHVKGDKGADILTVNAGTAAAATDIALGASLSIKLDGGKEGDTIAVNTAGDVDGTLKVRASGGKEDDTVAGNLVLNAGSTGSVKAKVKGGKDDDALTLNITGAGAATAQIDAVLDGGQGTDTGIATANVVVKRIP